MAVCDSYLFPPHPLSGSATPQIPEYYRGCCYVCLGVVVVLGRGGVYETHESCFLSSSNFDALAHALHLSIPNHWIYCLEYKFPSV